MTLAQFLVAMLAKLNEISSKVDNMSGLDPAVLDTINTSLTDLKVKTAGLGQRLDAVEASIATLQTESLDQANSIAKLRTDVDAINAGLGDLSGLPNLP